MPDIFKVKKFKNMIWIIKLQINAPFWVDKIRNFALLWCSNNLFFVSCVAFREKTELCSELW